MTSAFPLSSPAYTSPYINNNPPPAPVVTGSAPASSSNAYEPDRVTISPAGQQALKGSLAVEDNGDGLRS
jgi:hypothetical protein